MLGPQPLAQPHNACRLLKSARISVRCEAPSVYDEQLKASLERLGKLRLNWRQLENPTQKKKKRSKGPLDSFQIISRYIKCIAHSITSSETYRTCKPKYESVSNSIFNLWQEYDEK
jgi:hypothetical protein